MPRHANFPIVAATSHSVETVQKICLAHTRQSSLDFSTGCVKIESFIDVAVEFRSQKDYENRKCSLNSGKETNIKNIFKKTDRQITLKEEAFFTRLYYNGEL
jgi:hypothetical protein